jgi:hypothetical protein
MTEDLDRRIRALAKAKGRSYSAIVADLLEQRLDDPLPYEGIASGPRDLSRSAERYLDKQSRERKS